MTVVILGEAEREFAESVGYYESKEAGLGWRFRTEVAEAVGWIEKSGVASSKTERIPTPQSACVSTLHRLPHPR
jgi:hypothetical protein